MKLYETPLTDDVLEKLIGFSAAWEQEGSCHGYHRNDRTYIEGNRVFLAEVDGTVAAYLFGRVAKAECSRAVIPDETPYFELEELYVVPDKRSQGIGGALFRFVEAQLRAEGIPYMMLSTATKNHRAILHFYIDEMGMDFWNARLFKKL